MTLDIRAFIFDLDGVLAGTPILHYHSWRRLAEEEYIPFTWEQHENMQGLSRRASLDVFLGGRPISDSDAQRLMDRKNSYFLEVLQSISPADCFPGTAELIREARAAGLKIGLGSSSQNARRVVEQLGLLMYFDAVADGHTVKHNKPAPDIFLWVAHRLGVTPRQSVVFEDSMAGMQAAISGGFWRVGLGGQHGEGAHMALPSLDGVTLDVILGGLSA